MCGSAARCCAIAVRLAILDEPFRGLDRAQRHELLARAREVWRDATLLCVTHDIEETLSFDRVLVVDAGASSKTASRRCWRPAATRSTPRCSPPNARSGRICGRATAGGDGGCETARSSKTTLEAERQWTSDRARVAGSRLAERRRAARARQRARSISARSARSAGARRGATTRSRAASSGCRARSSSRWNPATSPMRTSSGCSRAPVRRWSRFRRPTDDVPGAHRRVSGRPCSCSRRTAGGAASPSTTVAGWLRRQLERRSTSRWTRSLDDAERAGGQRAGRAAGAARHAARRRDRRRAAGCCGRRRRAPLWQHMRHAHLPRRLLVFLIAYAGGRAGLGRLVVADRRRRPRGPLRSRHAARVELPAAEPRAARPLRDVVARACSWSVSAASSSCSCWPARLKLDPDETRHQGIGQHLARVIESESLEGLALAGGFYALTGCVRPARVAGRSLRCAIGTAARSSSDAACASLGLFARRTRAISAAANDGPPPARADARSRRADGRASHPARAGGAPAARRRRRGAGAVRRACRGGWTARRSCCRPFRAILDAARLRRASPRHFVAREHVRRPRSPRTSARRCSRSARFGKITDEPLHARRRGDQLAAGQAAARCAATARAALGHVEVVGRADRGRGRHEAARSITAQDLSFQFRDRADRVLHGCSFRNRRRRSHPSHRAIRLRQVHAGVAAHGAPRARFRSAAARRARSRHARLARAGGGASPPRRSSTRTISSTRRWRSTC